MFTEQIFPGSRDGSRLNCCWSPPRVPWKNQNFIFHLENVILLCWYEEKLEIQIVYSRFYAFREGAVPRHVTSCSSQFWHLLAILRWARFKSEQEPHGRAIAVPSFSPAHYANTFIHFPVVKTMILGSFISKSKTNKWSGSVSIFIFTCIYIYEYFNVL